MSKKHTRSRIDDFIKEGGMIEETQSQAVKEVVVWQLAEAMKTRKFRKRRGPCCSRRAARRLRLLDAKNEITLSSLQRAAAIIERRVANKLV